MEADPQVINVAIPLNLSNTFSYTLPEGVTAEESVGKRVMVDFGRRRMRGYAVSVGEYTTDYPLKPVVKIIDKNPIFTEAMVEFARWISSYYFSGLGEALSLMVPNAIRPKQLSPDTPDFTPQINSLSPRQEEIYRGICSDIEADESRFYLYGVTGSGKTEIYFKLIEDVINSGKGVIFLVPEIVLSYQTLERLKKRFGPQCAVLHSGLTGSQRLGEYLRLLKGEARIAVGPRSALFAPIDDIGLIIIDEENEGAYKSEISPRFHARTAAMYLAREKKALLLLGSATPAIESWFYAQRGFFRLYALNERYGKAELPAISIIDTNSLPYGKNLSPPLTQEINRRLQNREQVVLLQNRRGFSNFIQCKSCKKVIECPKCSVSLTYHKSKESLICHRCGYLINYPQSCPECGEKKLERIGAGTQRIEEEISEFFKHAVIERLDYDSIKGQDNLNEVFKRIENGEVDIIVGTQMISKGLHFPNIKFVGIINADILLNIPDFKTAERTFSLVTQVAGRAGREGTQGLVMIQTLNPEHYSITNAGDNNYNSFYNEEIGFRELLMMPPFLRLVRLVVRSKDESKAAKEIAKVMEIIKKSNSPDVQILGTAPCIIPRINNNFRFQILLKARKVELMQQVVRQALKELKISSGCYLEIDVDPTDLF